MRKLLALGERLGGVVRRPRPYLAVVFPLAIPLILATVSVVDPSRTAAARTTAAMISSPTVRYDDLASSGFGASVLPEHSMLLAVEEDDTLDGILKEGGLDRSGSALLNREFGRTLDLRRLRPGNLLRFHYDSAGKVDSVEMKVTGWGEIDAVRSPNGFEVTPRPAEVHEVRTSVAARIDSSLYESVRGAGEEPQLVPQLVDVFQWDIDFFALTKGDSFSVVVQKKYAGTDYIGYGPILAAHFTHNGQTFEAFRNESPEGSAGYYAANGTPLRKEFLRAPLAFTRITSTFSNRRFHPILHYFRPHHGVDYGAPVGTPVMVTADGVVLAPLGPDRDLVPPPFTLRQRDSPRSAREAGAGHRLRRDDRYGHRAASRLPRLGQRDVARSAQVEIDHARSIARRGPAAVPRQRGTARFAARLCNSADR